MDVKWCEWWRTATDHDHDVSELPMPAQQWLGLFELWEIHDVWVPALRASVVVSASTSVHDEGGEGRGSKGSSSRRRTLDQSCRRRICREGEIGGSATRSDDTDHRQLWPGRGIMMIGMDGGRWILKGVDRRDHSGCHKAWRSDSPCGRAGAAFSSRE